MINRIFQQPGTGQRSSTTTKNTLNPVGRTALNQDGGYGVQKFLKPNNKGNSVVEKIRSQISSQESTTNTTTRQSLRQELYPRRPKATKNSNSSSESRKAIGMPYRGKGSQPAPRTKNASTSSERKAQ